MIREDLRLVLIGLLKQFDRKLETDKFGVPTTTELHARHESLMEFREAIMQAGESEIDSSTRAQLTDLYTSLVYAAPEGWELFTSQIREYLESPPDWPKDPQYEPKTDAEKTGHVLEECGEVLLEVVAQIGRMLFAMGKVARFGGDNCHPEGGPTNTDKLVRELDDLLLAVRRARAMFPSEETL